MLFKPKHQTFSIRKLNVGIASIVVGLSIALQTIQTVEAQDTNFQIQWKYVERSELSEQQLASMITNLKDEKVGKYHTYYAVYEARSTVLPKTNEDLSSLTAMVGGGSLLLIGIGVLKGKRKKVITSIALLTTLGTFSLDTLAIEVLSQYNQTMTLRVGDAVPDGNITIEGYSFVGYIPADEVSTDVPSPSVVNEGSSANAVLDTDSTVSDVAVPNTVTESIPFETIYVEDPELLEGREELRVAGVSGTQTLTYIKGELISTEVVDPVHQVIARGTKKVIQPVDEVKVVTEIIPYETEIQETSELLEGERKILQSGVSGVKELTYTNGILSGEQITKPAVNEIVQVGIKRVEVQTLPFETTYVEDPELLEGREELRVAGVSGTQTLTYVKGELISTEVVAPVTQVIARGTKNVSQPVDEVKVVTEIIPYETEIQETSELLEGERKILQLGVSGVKELTYTNGILSGEQITKPAVNEIVQVGTKRVAEPTEGIDVDRTPVPLPIETTYIDDDSLYVGDEVEVSQGKEGEKVVTTTYRTVRGVRTGDGVVSEEITVPMERRVVRRGTKKAITLENYLFDATGISYLEKDQSGQYQMVEQPKDYTQALVQIQFADHPTLISSVKLVDGKAKLVNYDVFVEDILKKDLQNNPFKVAEQSILLENLRKLSWYTSNTDYETFDVSKLAPNLSESRIQSFVFLDGTNKPTRFFTSNATSVQVIFENGQVQHYDISNTVTESSVQKSLLSNGIVISRPTQDTDYVTRLDLGSKIESVTLEDLKAVYPLDDRTWYVLSDEWQGMAVETKKQLVNRLLANSYWLDDSSISQNYLANKIDDAMLKDLLFVSLYTNRFYNFDIGSATLSDFILTYRNIFGKEQATFETIVAAFKQANTKSMLSGGRTGEFYKQYVNPILYVTPVESDDAIAKTVESLVDIYQPAFKGKYSEWFRQAFDGIVEDVAPIANVPMNYNAWTLLKELKKANLVLPVLSKNNEGTYLIGSPMQLIVGSMGVYAPSGTNTITEELRNTVKEKAKAFSDLLYRYFDTLTKVNPSSTELMPKVKLLSVDAARTFNSTYQAPSATEDKTIRNLYNLANLNMGGELSETAFANGSEFYILRGKLLDLFFLFTHEMVHNIDRNVLLNGLGRRANVGIETYAVGMFEQKINEANINMNFVYDRDKTDFIAANWTRDRINSPEKFADFYKKLFQTIDLLDYLQGKAVLQLEPMQQSIVLKINAYGNTPDSNPADPTANRTLERLMPNKFNREYSNMITLEDLIRNKFGMYPGRIDLSFKRNDYTEPSIFDTNWYMAHDDAKTADSLATQYIVYRMAAEKGYVDGLLTAASGSLNDLEVLRKVTGNPDLTYETYKIQKYDEVKQSLANQTTLNEEKIIQLFVEAMKKDLENRDFQKLSQTYRLRKTLYYNIKRITDDFRSDIYGNVAAVKVSTAQELINAMKTNPYADIQLTADIDFSTISVAKNSSYTNAIFYGRIDGDGHALKNLKAALTNQLSSAYISNLLVQSSFSTTNLVNNLTKKNVDSIIINL
ncbi:G5 domain-containing protein [Streptococcus suis]|nr:G5 domain-containing protein [Streptococcus suis]